MNAAAMAAGSASASPVAIIAAGGTLPFAVADAVLARGAEPVLFALKGLCDPASVSTYRHHWIALGQAGRLIRLMRDEHCSDVVLIGSMVRPALREIRLDWKTIRLMPALATALRGGDDRLLTSVGKLFEQEGFVLRGLAEMAPELLMPAGVLSATAPNERDTADIAAGLDVLGALGPFDVGQAAIVIDGHVVAVEDIEGTDGLLKRIAQLRGSGRLRAPRGRGVLVKAPKRTQDLRFDLPTVGVTTVDNVAAAGLRGLAVMAGRSLAVDPQAMIAAADRSGMFVVGVTP
jgi:DUF1009 family protein